MTFSSWNLFCTLSCIFNCCLFYYYHVGAVFIALEGFFCQLDAFSVSLVAFYDIAGRIVCVADCVFHLHL